MLPSLDSVGLLLVIESEIQDLQGAQKTQDSMLEVAGWPLISGESQNPLKSGIHVL